MVSEWVKQGPQRDPTDKGTFDVCYVKLNVSTVRADVGQMEMFDLSAGAR